MPIKDAEKRKAYQRNLWVKRMKDPILRDRRDKSKAEGLKQYRIWFKELMRDFRKDGCYVCAENCHSCLCAHHLNPAEKKMAISAVVAKQSSKKSVKRELAKCICLCHNCHAKLHGGDISLLNQKPIES